MSAESNKDIVRRWVVDVWGAGKFGLIRDLATPDYTYRSPQDGELTGQAFIDLVTQIRSAFPDIRNTIDEQIVEGDTVVTRGTTRGTHHGAFGAMPATGKSVTVPWVVITQLRDGRIARDFEIYDALGLMQQLGVATQTT